MHMRTSFRAAVNGAEGALSARNRGARRIRPRKAALATLAFSGILAATLSAGCSGDDGKGAVKLDPSNPTTITVWDYYNGAQQASFDNLVSEFNSTVGKEQGIYVKSQTQGSVPELEKAISSSAAGEVGAAEMPDVFSSYADTAYDVQKQGQLVDLTDYFTPDELSNYVPDYLDEGRFDGGDSLYLLPLAKSTEVTMLDETDWEPFAQATGATVDDLATQEGIAATAKRYYEYTDALTPDIPDDGKAFYGRDSLSNYFIIGMKQMGVELLAPGDDGEAEVNADKDKVRRLWDSYYVPYVCGYFDAVGKFRSDDVKTGDIICYTGSTASAAYFPDRVVDDNGTHQIDYRIIMPPTFEGGSAVAPQQGAGMAVAKSDEQHEYAACEFLKWFTEKQNNLRFVATSSYLPVRTDANSVDDLDSAIENDNLTVSPKTRDCIAMAMDSFDDVELYSLKSFDNAYAARKVLDSSLNDRATADKAAAQAAMASGQPRAEALEPYLGDAAFEQWYASFCQQLQAAAKGVE
ncbi:extracellular solute-binding protein [uncultured Senegalimassilia sp.]|uniref:extracellular solute-binding protein n=1 Tax=uncultured Senegalimassilia sp. TaxID=1714350 RepID=UPI0025E30FF9|nr:extracellular solute-binding protein [uncultured Senegalimassilia sp.]